MNKNYTIISDLEKKLEIEDDNLIIVEDAEDTKQSTILELKKCFTGDYKDPSDKTFYTSKKIDSYANDLKRQLSTLASDSEVKAISKRLEDIIASNGTGKDNEIVDARDGQPTLSARLERDLHHIDDKYMEKIHRTIEGTQVSTNNIGYINIYLKNMSGASATVNFKSKNLLNIANNTNTTQVTYTATGFEFKQLEQNNLSVTLKLGNSLPKGKYYFFANIEHDEIFQDKRDIILAVKNSNDTSATAEFTYDQSGQFTFEAPKAFNEIELIYNSGNFVLNSVVAFKNVMLTRDNKHDVYVPFETRSLTIEKDKSVTVYNNDYDITCSDSNAIIVVEYYDKSITADTIQKDIDELKSVIIDNRDKCGLIENYGEYLFFDNVICETPDACKLSYDKDKYMRNGVESLKCVFEENNETNPSFVLELNKYVDTVDSMSLVFYIDRTVSYYFTSMEPITVHLCSDSYTEPEMVNYFTIKLNKDELMQGWNIIKKSISEFDVMGMPNEHGIKYVKIEIAKNSGLDNREMYFNSVVFNQKMKPTVLLAFDGIYEDGLTFTYPYLTTRDIPATILSNNRTTFTRNVYEYVVDLRARYGWDLGQYGCNPNKELLIEDNNAREQYLALRTAKEWLIDNLIYNPISYSAPYGNLRPITVPLLKDLGYKIAKTGSTGYCNFFDPDYDFAIPMVLMSNETTEEEIIKKIQYAIDNNCCICIYTNNVTNYGDEASAKKSLFESVIKFIIDNRDKITPMTFSEFYNKCNS